jgi:Ni/Fe-hydrogenase subunit HybB-like protein
MILAGNRLHAYWQTPLLPLLFLLSCWLLGYAFVILASLLSSLAWRRPLQLDALTSLSRVMAWVIGVFLAVRAADLIARGQWVVFPLSRFSALVLIETACLAVPAAAIASLERPRARTLFLAVAAVLVGGGLYRLDTALIGFMPGPQYRYFPSVLEMLVTAGFTSAAILAYIVIVKRFPILQASGFAPSRG